jgi:hypothetical protein
MPFQMAGAVRPDFGAAQLMKMKLAGTASMLSRLKPPISRDVLVG